MLHQVTGLIINHNVQSLFNYNFIDVMCFYFTTLFPCTEFKFLHK